ncbi:MAG: hypothetical protein JSR83_10145 [Proteobacteria bacterium]|nr:hypothetical protein [Pseudomonadota bacterium]
MSKIQEALEAAKAALTARPRLVVTVNDLNMAQADFNPYATELAMIERALIEVSYLDVGLRSLLAEKAASLAEAERDPIDVTVAKGAGAV